MSVLGLLREDVRTVFEKDPAARTTLEVLTCYPGLHAVWIHRLVHPLWNAGLRWLPRFISHLSRFLTGIEIHPAADIGRRFFIDHGGGVVIGETAEVGDDVVLYQGCTLGGTSLEREKRHPTVEDHVVIGAGAILLGPIRIGHDTKVGAGSVVLDSVEPNSTVVGVPASHAGEPEDAELNHLEHGDLPDPIKDTIAELEQRYQELERRLEAVEDDRSAADASEEPSAQDAQRS